MSIVVRPVSPADETQLLRLNNAAVPAVNELDEAALRAILSDSHLSIAVVDERDLQTVLGFVVTFVAGAPYDSENYRWFETRSDDFLYVDRIVVADGHRGRKLGQVLYSAVFEAARDARRREVFCEVNLQPPNPGSLAFHGRLGFSEVGQQATKGGTVVVSLMAAQVAGR
ncbi:GNAT family N-acetyltransferase [Subtercola frigoramans]|uniref:GNAT superfamily acetyltransferase n=1 Tax=Subtercola frigoramans TaxID=120298 RepID=A0ABS2L6R7_9MICO|nr:GNAT family N-acetyltransferase [Subtercola frigoramans]MBM7472800.1 putative GNAT superfamily acetyltransferase [Subtercola frigoramans]